MTGEIFLDLGKQISKAAEEVGKKTNEVIAKQKIRNQIIKIEKEVIKHYEEMGRSIEAKYEKKETVETECLVLCEAISEKKKLIEMYKEQLLAAEHSKACKNCGIIIDKRDVFCRGCGSNANEKNAQDAQGEKT
jgi:hypothetical protein